MDLPPAGWALDTEDAVLRHIEREVGENRLALLPRVRESDAVKAHALIIRVRSASFHHARRFVHQTEQTTGGGEGLGEVRGQGGDQRQHHPGAQRGRHDGVDDGGGHGADGECESGDDAEHW